MFTSGPSSQPAPQPAPSSRGSSDRPSVRSLGLPAPAEGAWLWLAHEMERVLDAAREATGLAHPGFTVVRILEAGAEVDTLIGWTDAEAGDVRVVDASRVVAAQLINVPEGVRVEARDAGGTIAGTVVFRCHLEVGPDGRLRAIVTSEGRLERRSDDRWRLLRAASDAGPPSFRHPPRPRAAA